MDIDSNFIVDRLEDLLSIVIVSSPCSSHPETTLIEKSIRSLSKFTGLEKCPIVIVLDGFIIRESARTKKGQITDSMSKQYDAYHHRLLALYGDNNQVQIKRSEDHLGFAMAVKFGLSFCLTTYGMVAQHDRVFVHSFHRLLDLIKLMEENEHMRYIGFPTIANRTHDSVLNSRYQISYLDSSEVKLNLGENLYLQPLIFWFDSQHLCHIKRYIQIYKPYAVLPEEMRNWLGKKTINKMVLRNGDFIEDRFGQSQRNCLTAKGANSFMILKPQCQIWIPHFLLLLQLVKTLECCHFQLTQHSAHLRLLLSFLQGKSDTFMLRAFRWFGSYLAWIPDDKAKVSRDGRGKPPKPL
jgi:hypothetical protein